MFFGAQFFDNLTADEKIFFENALAWISWRNMLIDIVKIKSLSIIDYLYKENRFFLYFEVAKMIGKIAKAKTKRGSSYSGSDLSGEYSNPHSCGDGTLESAPNCNSGGHV